MAELGLPPRWPAAAARRDPERRDPPDRRPGARGERRRRRPAAGARHRGDPARPHRAAGADRRAGLRARLRRGAALAAHEAANRLHTVVSLVELGRAEEAVEFATAELGLAQALTDRVVGAVASRCWPRCCWARRRGQRARRGAGDQRGQPSSTTLGLDAARPGDDPRQPDRQRGGRGHGGRRARAGGGHACAPTTTTCCSGSPTAARARPGTARRRSGGAGPPRATAAVSGWPWSGRRCAGTAAPIDVGDGPARCSPCGCRCRMDAAHGSLPHGRPIHDLGAGRRGRAGRRRRATACTSSGCPASRWPGWRTRAAEALRFLRRRRRSTCILLDLYLPDMHGLEVCRALRAAGHHCATSSR